MRGGSLKLLTILDEYTRECHVLWAERALKAKDVLHWLQKVVAEHGAPEFLRSDNGSEFIAKIVQRWLKANRIWKGLLPRCPSCGTRKPPLWLRPVIPWWRHGFGGNMRPTPGSQPMKLKLTRVAVSFRWNNRGKGLREILCFALGRPERVKVSLLAASHKTFRNRFQLLPPRANLFRFGAGDFVVRRRGGDDGEQVGEFLNNLVGGRNEKMRVRRVLRVHDEKPAGALADPLDEALVASALDERLNAVKRVADIGIRLGPFVNHRG